MLKPGALVLLLAVAASQVEPHLSLSIIGEGDVDLSACPIVFYGREHSTVQMSYNDSEFAFCSLGPDPDCVLLTDLQGDRVSVEIRSEPTNAGSLIHQGFPLIQSDSSCYVQVSLQDQTNDTHLQVLIYNFGTEGGVVIRGTSLFNQTQISVTLVIGQLPPQTMSATKSEVDRGLFLDMSACRYSGSIVGRGSGVYEAETCSFFNCSSAAVLTSASACSASEVCQSDTGCVPRPLVCTVTASTVIDFFRNTHSVTNRCAYSLVRPQADSAFNVLAAFRDRRRQDVMFLDRLMLWLRDADVTMYLEQGGRVQVNGQTLQLNATAQLIHGVELSKDQTGVTARIPDSNITVYFDGNTAHVAGSPTGVEGLCGNPDSSEQRTTLGAEKFTSYSISGCETEYVDPANETTDCPAAAEPCSLIMQAPFAACHQPSAPDAFVSACNHTLCNYPAVDGLRCQFLEAYAKSCQLQGVPLEDWRSTASCHADLGPVCLDRYCSQHEFCGGVSGEASCLCRATFSSSSPGDQTVCTDSSASLSLAGCLLQDQGLDYTELHLIDETCKGHMDAETHMVTFSFDLENDCGAQITRDEDRVLYQNTIMTKSNSSGSVIVRHNQAAINFSCYYERPSVKTLGFKIIDSSVTQHVTSGVWNYTVEMSAYSDAARTHLVGPTTEIRLNQKVWVELKAEGLDEDSVAVVIESCWATDRPATNGSVSYNLISNGCPNTQDQTVELTSSGPGTSHSFSFNMFEFSGDRDGVYLHCEVKLCLRQQETCVQDCVQGRRRRSARRRSARGPGIINAD